ncbi:MULTISPECIES: phosphohistidine phosphatase SixA [unclassified Acinetobacter]|uniref:phosphohistidine phosphatase SixA n=1 Tax=unclassified Acinetobacter TaxID=196816 RepID=UPI0035B9E6BF
MRLILIRHGEADPDRTGIDSQRALTERGHLQAQQTANFLKEQGIVPDLFVVSPYLRANQTLSHIQAVFPDVATETYANITPDDPAAPAFQWLAQKNEQTIVVVCHMNIIAYIASLMTEDAPEGFELAEARVYDHVAMMVGLSNEMQRFVPTI